MIQVRNTKSDIEHISVNTKVVYQPDGTVLLVFPSEQSADEFYSRLRMAQFSCSFVCYGGYMNALSFDVK